MCAGAGRAQRRDTLIERRMAHEQPRQTAANAAIGDAESLELLRGQRLVAALEVFQRPDHVAGTGELRPAAIRAELALAREPHDDRRREQPEYDLQHVESEHRG